MSENIVTGGLDLSNGQHATFIGQETGEVELKDFVGVNVVYDKIRKEYAIRTQIPAVKV